MINSDGHLAPCQPLIRPREHCYGGLCERYRHDRTSIVTGAKTTSTSVTRYLSRWLRPKGVTRLVQPGVAAGWSRRPLGAAGSWGGWGCRSVRGWGLWRWGGG